MPKFKFSNSTLSTDKVTVLPCKNMEEFHHEFPQAGGEVTYQFDNNDNWVLRLAIPGQWFTGDDIGEFIEFLKAAKKRADKLALRNAEG